MLSVFDFQQKGKRFIKSYPLSTNFSNKDCQDYIAVRTKYSTSVTYLKHSALYSLTICPTLYK